MVLCTTRGYILNIWGGYGGGGKFSDVKLWKNIISEAQREDGPSILTALPKGSGIVVDRGFRGELNLHLLLKPCASPFMFVLDKDGELDKHFDLLAPKGNKKANEGIISDVHFCSC